MPNPFPAYYQAALHHTGGVCPIEAGLIGRLADNECKHGRLPGDRTAKCGCWAAEGALVIPLTPAPQRQQQRPLSLGRDAA